MKTSLKMLRELARLKHHRRDKRPRQPLAQWEEIAQADQEMQDIKDCYERLISGAAATTNSVYEFSESLKEIGDLFLEKTALNFFDDEESDKVLLTIGKVQLQVQRLFDVYRSHISRTITVPSESLLNELQTVEEMKLQCEGKRLAYEEALKKQKEKGKSKSGKADCFPSQHLEDASDDYDQEVNSLLFRMRSLKQGQCRSLLTQAVRHFAAQRSLFKKVHLSLEAVEPCVKYIAEHYHIDYDFSGLEDADDDDGHEYGEGNDTDADDGISDDIELSFNYRQDHPRHYMRNPVEDVEQLSPYTFGFQKEVKEASKSAPLFSDKRSDPNYKLIEMRSSSTKKHASYALPTPSEAKSPVSAKSKAGVPHMRDAILSPLNPYNSSPLAKNQYEKVVTNDVVSGPLLSDTKSLLRDTNQNIPSRPFPPPLLNGFSPPKVDPSFSSNTKKVKRHAFSGPVAGKQWHHKPAVTAGGSIGSAGHPFLSRSPSRTPRDRPLSTPTLPSHTSSTFTSSPRISELHELPRPPPHLAFKRPSPNFDYSEPLRPKGTEFSTANKVGGSATVYMHPMPSPLSRSYSIPTRGHVTEPMVKHIPSPPLTPLPLLKMHPASPTS